MLQPLLSEFRLTKRFLMPRSRHELMTSQSKATEKAIPILESIMKIELAGVVRYTHYSVMVAGPNRMPFVEFLKAQAMESLTHAQAAGEIHTGHGGHPGMDIRPIEESHEHSIEAIIEESLLHEQKALTLYKELLSTVADQSVYLEEYARSMVGQEELHAMELRKMLTKAGTVDERAGGGSA